MAQRARGTSRWVRIVALLVAMALVVVGIPVLVNAVSVQPGAAMTKYLFELGPAVTPPAGYAAIEETVMVDRNIRIPVDGAPSASIDVYSPKTPTSTALPLILWVHGGGFLSGSKTQVAPYVTMLAHAGYVVASLEYSLAPGTRYPAPVRQGNAALAYLEANAARFGADGTRVFLGGDSAGAQIASELAAVQSNPTLASSLDLAAATPGGSLRGVVLFCGLYDMDTVGATGFPALRTFLWSYTGTRDWTRYADIDQLSTTKQVTDDYPATFLSVGDADPFQSQAVELAKVLTSHGVPLTTEFWNGSGKKLGHEYQFVLTTPEATKALADTLTFLSTRAKGQS
jgi:acetyl esterase/lipase